MAAYAETEGEEPKIDGPEFSTDETEFWFMNYDRPTRWIHFGLGLVILSQLASSLFMVLPKPGRNLVPLEAGAFEVHRLIGMGAFYILAIHWFWILTGHLPEGVGHLFPWYSGERSKKVWEDAKPLLKFDISALPEKSALAGAVEGLGLLLTTLMATTGVFLFLGISPQGEMSRSTHIVKNVHGFMATFVWIYLIGHCSMGVLHQLLGHRTLSKMFNLIER